MTKTFSPFAYKTDSPRREFLKTIVIGGGASLLTVALDPRSAFGSGHADALLLTCMDYRLLDDTERYMTGRGLRDKYDQVVLAGASLGAVTDKYHAWNQTFWDHLSLAIQLHGIHRVIVLDHRDCGAYKLILGEGCCDTRAGETLAHKKQLELLRAGINKSFPQLEVELLLMDLDGKVEKIG